MKDRGHGVDGNTFYDISTEITERIHEIKQHVPKQICGSQRLNYLHLIINLKRLRHICRERRS